MSKEETPKQEEQALDFEKATEMTVGQATRKSEELAAGVTDKDNALEKYIKQHRAEIEAGKFGSTSASDSTGANSLKDFIQEQREAEPLSAEIVAAEEARIAAQTAAEAATARAAESQAILSSEGADIPVSYATTTPPPVTPSAMDTVPVVEAPKEKTASSVTPSPIFDEAPEEVDWDADEKAEKRKRTILYSGLLAAAFLLIGGSVVAYNIYNSRSNNNGTVTASSSSTSASSSESSSSSASAEQTFTDLYNSFYTDSQHTALKNSSFGNLDQLKTALDALQGTANYDTYKKQYDDLVAQVTAVQTVNSQFTTAAITDGVLDSNAQAKTDANFTDTTTGNSSLDSLLASAVSQGRSQVAPSPAPQTETAAATTSGTASASSTTAATNTDAVVNGVLLQRSLSRVPYNQAAIDDVNNPAWTFASGVLEKILETSRQRGYFTGDNYILERVNIINGNGYYNLFKSDGTYLFSINAKTGYFVGNAKGNADALDF